MSTFQIYLGFMTLVFFAMMCFLHRNHCVHSERTRIINEIGRLSRLDIDHHINPQYRWEAYDEISYETMMWKFWIPVKDFYRDHRCLKG